MKVEDNRRVGEFSETSSAYRQRYDRRDHQGSDIFGFSNVTDEQAAYGKKKIVHHTANQTNGNLTYWDK
jgi:hypothetical protein